ncbi:MAG: hypothetical protein JO039_15435, partial [Solirubrobacterales bacterium]|nr:hypothetical protein [Solirubrobacterales bacterium]
MVAATVLVLLVGIWLGGHPSWMPSSLRNTFVDDSNGQLVNQVLDLIQRNYYRPVSRSQLLNKGIAAADRKSVV